MARTKRARSTRKRKSSPAGVEQRVAARTAAHVTQSPKGGSGFQYQPPPGSRNPRKI